MSVVDKLTKKGLITPPPWMKSNIHYEVIMGSFAYGVSSDDSDRDIYGFCIPPKYIIFPHLAGEIMGFGRQHERFEQFLKHHINAEDEGKQYDVTIYNIVKYFQLCMDNNPNMVDSLFVPQYCVLHCTQVGNMVRENRKLFLHKGSFHKFKGYAFSQLHKMSSKEPTGKRKEIREEYGFDVKFAYHVVRLLGEVEQILIHGDIDLQRDREHLKAIRRGEVSEADIRQWFAEKEKYLENLYNESTAVPYSPDEEKIKQLLLNCLEHHYGSLQGCLGEKDLYKNALIDIFDVVSKYHRLIQI